MAIKFKDVVDRWTNHPLGMAGTIAALRKERNLMQEELVRELRLHGYKCKVGYLGGVERGRADPSEDLLVALEKVFDLELGSLAFYARLVRLKNAGERVGISLDVMIELLYRALIEVEGYPQTQVPEGVLRRLAAKEGIRVHRLDRVLASMQKAPPDEFESRINAFVRAVERTEGTKHQKVEYRQKRKGKGG